MKSISILLVFTFQVVLSFAQHIDQEIELYRNMKHEAFSSDPYSPVRADQISSLAYFPINTLFRVEAEIQLLENERVFRMPTYDGTSNPYKRYAILHFKVNGQNHSLTVYQSATSLDSPIYKDHLFLPFLDLSNNQESYGGGRYIDLNIKNISNNKIIIDFNKAYNPYCAYSNGYRCPQPPMENSLPIAILAGEKKYNKAKNERIVNQENAKGFSENEKEIINQNTGKMHVYQTTDEHEFAVLRKTSEDIRPDDPLLQKLADRMLLTVTDEDQGGVGIAAPQVGINKNLIWVQRFDKAEEPFEFYINPKIIWRSQLTRLGKEGCLSIPDRREDVQRNYAIRLQYWTKEGKIIEENIEGLTAVIFQHEVDHLYGILYPDRLEEQDKKELIPINEKIEFSIPENSILP